MNDDQRDVMERAIREGRFVLACASGNLPEAARVATEATEAPGGGFALMQELAASIAALAHRIDGEEWASVMSLMVSGLEIDLGQGMDL